MSTPISSNEVLNAFETVSPILPIILDNDASFAIADTQKFLKVHNSPNLTLKTIEGEAIPEGGAAREAINSGEVIIRTVPKEVYGVPFKSYAIPVKGKDGSIEGVVLVGKSLAKKNKVLELSQHLSVSAQQISDAIGLLTKSVNNLANMNMDIANNVKQTNETTKDTDSIIQFVEGVSSQTNLLGLNAAIESARAGEYGRGFNVVAKEIRKLSLSTTESIKKIDSVLKNISSSIKNITENITNSNELLQEQASAFQEIAASIEELNSAVQTMESLAEKI